MKRLLLFLQGVILSTFVLAQDISHAVVYYTEKGDSKSLTVQAGDHVTISRDHGTQIDVRVYRSSSAANENLFQVVTWNDGGTYEQRSTSSSVLFRNIGDATTTLITCVVNTNLGSIRINVENLSWQFPDLYPRWLYVNNSQFFEGKEFEVGETVEIKVSVQNVGEADAGRFRTGFYIAKASSDYSDRFSYRSANFLESNHVIDQIRSYTFNQNDVGTRYFNVWTDYKNEVDEGPSGDHNNKKSWGPFTVKEPPKFPEAKITERSLQSSEVDPNQPLMLTVKMKNTGDGHATTGGISLSFPKLTEQNTEGLNSLYVSSQGNVGINPDLTTFKNVNFYDKGSMIWNSSKKQISADYLLVEGHKNNWAPNEEHSFYLVITPSRPGDFTINIRGWMEYEDEGLSADPAVSGSGIVTDQQGFSAYREVVSVSELLPDLIISNVGAPDEVVQKGDYQISFTVENIGDAATPLGFANEVRISQDQIFENGTHLAFRNSSSLDAGEQHHTGLFDIRIPESLSGQAYILVKADAAKVINELDETNNVRAHPVFIHESSDIVLEELFGEIKTSYLFPAAPIFANKYSLIMFENNEGDYIWLPFKGSFYKKGPEAKDLVDDPVLAEALYVTWLFFSGEGLGMNPDDIIDYLKTYRDYFNITRWWDSESFDDFVRNWQSRNKRKTDRVLVGNISFKLAGEILKAKVTGGKSLFGLISGGLLEFFRQGQLVGIHEQDIQHLLLAHGFYSGDLSVFERMQGSVLADLSIETLENIKKIKNVYDHAELAGHLVDAEFFAYAGNMSGYSKELVEFSKGLQGMVSGMVYDNVSNVILSASGLPDLKEQIKLFAWLHDAYFEAIHIVSKDLIQIVEEINSIIEADYSEMSTQKLNSLTYEFASKYALLFRGLNIGLNRMQLNHLAHIRDTNSEFESFYVGAKKRYIDELSKDYETLLWEYDTAQKSFNNYASKSIGYYAGYGGALKKIKGAHKNSLRLSFVNDKKGMLSLGQSNRLVLQINNDYSYPILIDAINIKTHPEELFNITYSMNNITIPPRGDAKINIDVDVPPNWFTSAIGDNNGFNDKMVAELGWQVDGQSIKNAYFLDLVVVPNAIISEVSTDKNLYLPGERISFEFAYKEEQSRAVHSLANFLLQPDGRRSSVQFAFNPDNKFAFDVEAPEGPYGGWGTESYLIDNNSQMISPPVYTKNTYYVVPKISTKDLESFNWNDFVIIYPRDDFEAAEDILVLTGQNTDNFYELEAYSSSYLTNIANNKDVILIGGHVANPLTAVLTNTSLNKEGDAIIRYFSNAFGNKNAIVVAGYTLRDTQIAAMGFIHQFKTIDIDDPDPKLLTLEPSTILLLSASGANASFSITSNVSWNVSSNQSWLTVSPSSGSNNGSVTVTASSQNPTINARSATVTVSGGGITRTVEVTQSGQANDPVIVVSPSALDYNNVLTGEMASRSYLLEGSNLLSDITITAPDGYFLHPGTGSTLVKSMVVPANNGSVSRNISVVFAPSAQRSYTGQVANASAGAVTSNVSVSGTGVTQQPTDVPVHIYVTDQSQNPIPNAKVTLLRTDSRKSNTDCPTETLISNPPDGSSAFYSSEDLGRVTYHSADHVQGGKVGGFVFYGIQIFTEDNRMYNCGSDQMEIRYRFYADNNGRPGTMLESQTLVTSAIYDPGFSFGGYRVYRFEVRFDTPVSFSGGWFSIYSVNNPRCWLAIIESSGNEGVSGRFADGQWTPLDGRISFCLLGVGNGEAEPIVIYTDSNGSARTQIPPGQYAYTVTKDGFDTATGTRSISSQGDSFQVILQSQVTANICIDPRVQEADALAGSLIPIAIDIAGVTGSNDFYGVSFDLNINDNRLELAGYQAGEMLGANPLVFTQQPSPSRIEVGASRTTTGQGATGSGNLMICTLRVTSNIPPNTEITLSLSNIVTTQSDGRTLNMQACGSSTISFTSGITVWPGDANNDGTVSNADILPLGLFYGKTGPARANDQRGCQWAPRVAPAGWDPPSAVFADCNGDGVVNNADVLCIGLNYGNNTGLKSSHQPSYMPEGKMNLWLKAVGEDDSEVCLQNLDIGDVFYMSVMADNATGLYGIAGKLLWKASPDQEDAPAFIEPVYLQNSNLLKLSEHWVEEALSLAIPATFNSIEVGVSNIGGVPVTGHNPELFRIPFRLLADAAGNLEFDFLQASGNDVTGNPIAFNVEKTTLSSIADSQPTLTCYPNPFRDVVHIDLHVRHESRVRVSVYNMLGAKVDNIVHEEVVTPGSYMYSWSSRGYENGLYFVRAEVMNLTTGKPEQHMERVIMMK